MKFLHISDLHFHRTNKKNTKVKMMLQTIKIKYPNHYLIVTGDITDDGSSRQYRHAYKALKKFMGKIFICPGNHDFGVVGNFYSKKRAKKFDRYLATPLNQHGTFYGDNKPVVNVVTDNNDSVMLIALDSNLETKHIFDFSCGKIGKSQLSGVKSILFDPLTSTMQKIIFFHHHPFIVNDNTMKLKDADKIMKLLDRKIEILMFGHKHKSKYWKNKKGIEHILASDNSPGTKNRIREIDINKGVIKVTTIQL
ncbi:MAG: metallophosphoesterase [Campylobacterota bacterium]|nr:metallophosphoesterase [Campylobacterota bacterium]